VLCWDQQGHTLVKRMQILVVLPNALHIKDTKMSDWIRQEETSSCRKFANGLRRSRGDEPRG
jgi:hypothetical protein